MAKSRSGERVFHVLPNQQGQTLAAALRAVFPDLPWSQVRKLASQRRVQVNGNLCLDASRRLEPGQVIKVFDHPKATPPTAKDVRIVFVDRHIVIVNKPSGITSTRHAEEKRMSRQRRQIQPTLDEMVSELLQADSHLRLPSPAPDKHKHAGGQRRRMGRSFKPATPPRPVFPVHRLDRDTSGLIAFARTPQAEAHLIDQFRQHTTRRVYTAIVLGHPAAMTIESHLVRDRGDGRRGSTQKSGQGQRAVTHVVPLEQVGPLSVVQCKLETGRTHQIRIHLSEQGHMVCGETIYVHSPDGKRVRDVSGAPRLALHAGELTLVHPTSQQPVTFHAPLPKDLQQFLQRWRKEK